MCTYIIISVGGVRVVYVRVKENESRSEEKLGKGKCDCV